MRTTDYFSADTKVCETCILKAFDTVCFLNKYKNSCHIIHGFLMVKICIISVNALLLIQTIKYDAYNTSNHE